MIHEQMNYQEEDLIAYLCKKVATISETKAIAIADYFDCSIIEFLQHRNFSHFNNWEGNQILSQYQIDEINQLVSIYIKDYDSSLNALWISVLAIDYIQKLVDEIREITIDNMIINPFIVKALQFDDHRELINILLLQKIFELDNKDKINNIPMLGMTYGTREQINSQIQSTLIDYPNSTMIGQELWDFIADNNGYCLKLLDRIDEIMKDEPTKFAEEIEKKRQSLCIEWENKFGIGKQSIDLVLNKYL